MKNYKIDVAVIHGDSTSYLNSKITTSISSLLACIEVSKSLGLPEPVVEDCLFVDGTVQYNIHGVTYKYIAFECTKAQITKPISYMAIREELYTYLMAAGGVLVGSSAYHGVDFTNTTSIEISEWRHLLWALKDQERPILSM